MNYVVCDHLETLMFGFGQTRNMIYVQSLNSVNLSKKVNTFITTTLISPYLRTHRWRFTIVRHGYFVRGITNDCNRDSRIINKKKTIFIMTGTRYQPLILMSYSNYFICISTFSRKVSV